MSQYPIDQTEQMVYTVGMSCPLLAMEWKTCDLAVAGPRRQPVYAISQMWAFLY
jgi:hypothetical protein